MRLPGHRRIVEHVEMGLSYSSTAPPRGRPVLRCRARAVAEANRAERRGADARLSAMASNKRTAVLQH